MNRIFALALAAALTACGTSPQTKSATSDVQAENLWAGLATYNFDRGARDVCGENPRQLTKSISYDSWARQRATHRNVCFQVWKPGATDQENPNFWRELDVQVHYLTPNGWQQDYVDAHDRQGNNRRYVWQMGIGLDPFYIGGNLLGRLKLAYGDLLVEQPGRQTYIKVPFYFTVNGNKLQAEDGSPYEIRYYGDYRNVQVQPSNNGPEVLHPDLSCQDGLTAGGGAGLFFVDIVGEKVETIKNKLLENNLFAGAYLRTSRTEDDQPVMSLGFAQRNNSPENVIEYQAGYTNTSKVTMTLQDNTVKFVVSAQGGLLREEIVELTETFSGCQMN